MDILAELRRALAEVRARMGGRKSQKKKKVRAPGRPAKTGRKSGCGTGAGGFGEGNDCAKEDGRPNVPKSFAQKGKQATAASLPATKEALIAKAATLEAAAKSAKASSVRKKAAIRKKEKQAKESAEKQAADAARAKKRAEMLQKIRIKKANEKLQIQDKNFGLKKEKPDDGLPVFAGKPLPDAARPGETRAEHLSRIHKQDLDVIHAEIEKIDKTLSTQLADITKARDAAKAAIATARERLYDKNLKEKERQELRAFFDKSYLEVEELGKQSMAAKDAANEKIHNIIGGFTRAYNAGKTAEVPKQSDVSFSLLPGGSKEGLSRAKAKAEKSWAFFSKTLSPVHAPAFRDSLMVRQGSGGSHDVDKRVVTIGEDAGPETFVHEYAHAIESLSPRTMSAMSEDYKKRLSKFLAETPGAKVKRGYVDYYEGPTRPSGNQSESESLLGYTKRYSDFGFNQSTISRYAGGVYSQRYQAGTEVFSTGAEELYRDPIGFSRTARGHFDATVLIFAGRM